MADQRLSDEEIQLRQKARQRLIGAVTLMMAAVVVLPWALDGKPRVHTHEIAVYLPASAPASNPAPSSDGHAASLPAIPAAPAPAASAAVAAAPSPAPAAPQPGTTAPASGADAQVAAAKAAPATVEPSHQPAAEQAELPAAAKAAPTVHAKPAKPVQTARAHPRLDATETQPGTHDAAAADKPARPAVTAGYVLQLGTFSEADNARQLKARLAAKGVPAFTEHLASPGGDRIRVRVGPYPSRAAAEQALSQVNALGLSGVVMNAH